MRYPLLLVIVLSCAPRQPEPRAILGPSELGADQIGQRAPSLAGVRWLDGNADPGALQLVRWWTDGCSLCSSSAPELTRIATSFPGQLQFSAIFHDKRGRATIDDVWLRKTATRTGFD